MKRVPANRYVIFLAIAVLGVTFDLYSKHVVFADLGYCDDFRVPIQKGNHEIFEPAAQREGESRLYLDGWLKFRLLTSFNEGALWGIGQGLTFLFGGLGLILIVGILAWLFYFGAAESRWLTVALAFVMAGALGNLWDRLALHGCVDGDGNPIYGVRDFLFFNFGTYPYPIFNFADAFLVTGAIMLFVQSFFPVSPSEKSSSENPSKNSAPATAETTAKQETAAEPTVQKTEMEPPDEKSASPQKTSASTKS
ncbi:MAG: hypothetical protein Tsb009_05010 [Planctomycetaceae bacterium]